MGKDIQKSHARRLGLLWFLLSVGVLWGQPAFPGSGSDGEDPCLPPDVPVRAKLHIPNNTGQTADDFHMYMYQKDRPGVNVNGASADCGSFSNVGVGLDSDNRGGSPNVPAVPPGVGPPYHGADVDMDGGSVPAGGTIDIDVMLCMNEKNSIKYDYYWTSGGDPIPGGGGPAGGFRAGGPAPGGGGGNPSDPGGGGQGAQAGGGGSGNYVHMISIENDSPTDCVLVTELKLLASMTYYSDVDSIDWASIDPIKNIKNQPPVIIPPLGKWWYAFETTGDYIGGHIYMKFDMTPASCTKSDAPKNGGSGTGMVGDHPVVEPSPDFDQDGLYDDWEFVFELSSTDDGSENPDNGPEGDPDHDGIPNIEEQALLTNPRDPSLAEALDTPSLTWTTEGAYPWFGQTLVSFDGVDAAVSGPLADNESSTLSTRVGGPGNVYFWWKVDSEANHDFLRFSIDGVLKSRISGNVWFNMQQYALGPGMHTLKWKYSKDASGSAGRDRAWVDHVFWIPTPISLGDALDNPGLTWTTSGDVAWYGQGGLSHDGVDAGRSGALANNQASLLSTEVTGPGTLSFWWKVDSELNHDILRFSIDGVLQDRISGSVYFMRKQYLLGPGMHTLKWKYSKDASGSAGIDAAWLDQVVWMPGT